MRSSIGATLVKWRRIEPSRIQRIAARLKYVQNAAPANTQELLRFGFNGERLRLELKHVPGVTLANLLQHPAGKDHLGKVAALLTEQIKLWQRENFIHGDLSLTNTLLTREQVHGRFQLCFIDWIVDLTSFEGTPQFASPEVFRGRRSHASDRYAIEKILCIVRRHNEGALNDARD